MDLKLKKWIKWIDEIKHDVKNILTKRHIFWEVNEIYSTNDKLNPSDIYFQYMGDTYIAFISMGIRRQLKVDSSSISLKRLLKEIYENPSLLSRDFYLSLYSDLEVIDIEMANGFYSRLIDNDEDKSISLENVEKDLESLKTASITIEAFGDKYIAHNDKNKPNKLPLFQEVDDCINLIDNLCCKYLNLLKAEGNSTLNRTIQNHWKNVFEYAWISK